MKNTMWNTKKENGWEIYNKITNDNSKLKEVSKTDSEDTTDIMKQIEKEVEKAKFKSFGKVKVGKAMKSSKEVKSLNKKKAEVIKSGNVDKLI